MRNRRQAHALAARDLRVVLGGKVILDQVSVSIGYGEFTVIAGPNGAGKSTLLRALLGLSAPDAGDVACDGIAMAKLTRLERARRIAYVPQNSLLDAAVCVEDVVRQARFAHERDADTEAALVARALRRVGMHALAHRSYLSLSGGERRLALIARALCTGARIICLDEPTACLDIANRLRILTLLRELADQGHAIICVLHELEHVRRFGSDVVLMSNGRVCAAGAPSDVIVADTVRAVYGVELRDNDAVGFRLGAEAAL